MSQALWPFLKVLTHWDAVGHASIVILMMPNLYESMLYDLVPLSTQGMVEGNAQVRHQILYCDFRADHASRAHKFCHYTTAYQVRTIYR